MREYIMRNKYIILVVFCVIGIGMSRMTNSVKADGEEVVLTLQPKYQVSETALATGENESVAQPGSSDNPYMIASVEDMINLQDYSKTNTCEGMYFEVDESIKNSGNSSSGNTGNEPQESSDITDEDQGGDTEIETSFDLNLCDEKFLGIGQSETNPFKGNINFKGITVKTNTNIFYVIGEGASISNLNIIGDITNDKNNKLYYQNKNSKFDNSGVAGLAYIAFASGEGGTSINISNINIQKLSTSTMTSIVGGTQCAAGIIAKVHNRSNGKLSVYVKNCKVNAKIRATGLNTTQNPNTTDNLYNRVGVVGGLIGQIETVNADNIKNLYVELENCVVEGELICDNSTVGGAIGNAWRGTYINLKTLLDVSGITLMKITNNNSRNEYKGYILGGQLNSIINKELQCNIKEPTDTLLNNVPDIGLQYDCSTNDRAPANLYYGLERIGDSSIEGNGTVENPYKISDAKDLAIISVVFCSEGKFFVEKFKDQNNNTANYASYIRTSHYLITNDINMSEYNIYRINNVYHHGAFAGTFEGRKSDGSAPTISFGNIDTRQCGVALWCFVNNRGAEQVTFKNFKVSGTINNSNDVAGVVYCIKRELDSAELNCTFEDVKSSVSINKAYVSGQNGFVGGVVGKILYATNCPKIDFKNIDYTGTITIGNSDNKFIYVGGLIGFVDKGLYGGSIINIDNYRFKGNIDIQQKINYTYAGATIGRVEDIRTVTNNMNIGNYSNIYLRSGRHKITINNSSYGSDDSDNICTIKSNADIGGILGRDWLQVDLTINNMSIKNINMTVNNSKCCGGLLHSATGNIDINGLSYDNFNINNPYNADGTTTLLMRVFRQGICDIDGLAIQDTCKISAKTSHDIVLYTEDIHSNPTQYVTSLVSINGTDVNGDIYSAYNGYESKAIYENTYDANMSCRAALFYNVFKNVTRKKDEETSSDKWEVSNIERGYIKGEGTKENPIIIDTPEKMVIYSAMTRASFSTMDLFFKYFDSYKDIDLSLVRDSSTHTSILQNVYNALKNLLCGYVIFADNLNMHVENKADSDTVQDDYGYSYNPIQVYGGYYYGFNAKKYLLEKNSNSSPSVEEMKNVCVNAIKVLEGESVTGMNISDINGYKPNISMDASAIHKYNNKTKYKYLDYQNSSVYYNVCGTAGRYESVFTHIKCEKAIISNIQIEGNYFYYGKEYYLGGALVGPYHVWNNISPYLSDYESVTNANITISYIDIGNVIVESKRYSGSSTDKGTGLLIAEIRGNSNVTLDNIKILNNANVRADALIGYQDGANTQVTFTNIDLNNAVNNELDSKGNSSEPRENYKDTTNKYGLRYGLFYYNLADGTALYNYDSKEYDNDTNIYTDDSMVTPIRNSSDTTKGKYQVNLKLLKNKNYAYKSKDVIVNMILGHITKGEGTKDSPFILTNVEQLLTLSYCLESGGANTLSNSWYVGNADANFRANDSSTWSNNKNTGENRVAYLRTAYYKLGANIDFTDSNLSIRVKQSIRNFKGIGTKKYPFSGYIEGDTTNGFNTITLSNYDGRDVNQFGLFYYTNGVYAKDLTISTANNSVINASNDANVGILSAFSQGGDSVIDNVIIDAKVKVKGESVSSAVAGYFGRMDYGSLTLLGDIANNLKTFNVVYGDGNTTVGTKSKYINAVVGKVVGGAYVVYHKDDVTENETQFVYTNSDTIADTGLRYTNDINILNNKFLESAGKLIIRKVSDTEERGYNIAIANEKQLYILSLGVSSGALSAYTGLDDGSYWPYRSASSTWKSEKCWGSADNNSWGNSGLVDSVPNNLSYPSILQYFEEEGEADGTVTIENYYTSGALIFNKAHNCGTVLNASKYNGTDVNSTKYNVTYQLINEVGIYNMSNMDFRGLGSGEHLAHDNWSYNPGAFAANIEGITKETYKYNAKDTKNTTIVLDIDNTVRGDYNESAGFIPTMGGINSSWGCPIYNIKNISLTGKVKTRKIAGGLIGNSYCGGSCVVEDVYIFDMQIESTGSYGINESGSGGFIGRSEMGNNHNFELKNSACDNITVKSNATSGLIVGAYRDSISIHDIEITNSNCTYISETSGSGYCGGVAGYAYDYECKKNCVIYDIIISDSNIIGKERVGGIIGFVQYANYTQFKTGMANITLDGVKIEKKNSSSNTIGKFIGYLDQYHNTHSSTYEIGMFNCEYINQPEDCVLDKYIGARDFNLNNVVLFNIKDYKDLDVVSDSKYKDLVYTSDSILNLIPDNDNESTNKIIKWSNDSGTINDVINSVLDNITGTTGLINKNNKRDDDKVNYNNNITINIIPMKVENGVATQSDRNTLNLTKDENGNYNIKAIGFDIGVKEEDDDNKKLTPETYSIIEITYSITDSKFSKTIKIPFFIDQTVNVDMYGRIMVGRKLNNTIFKDNANESLNVTEDSAYSLYTEYTYSNTRTSFSNSVYVKKAFTMDKDNTSTIPNGTLLTLVDRTDGINKTYYYEVNNNESSVLLTNFKDENGNKFKERDITKTSELASKSEWITFKYNNGTKTSKFRKRNCGVEQFFVYIDCSKVANGGDRSSISCNPAIVIVDESSSIADEKDQTLFSRVRCSTKVENYSGQKIGFKESKASITLDNGTDSTTSEGSEVQGEQSSSVSNKLNKNTKVTMSATISNTASDTYWSTVKNDDYSNKDKYLEVAMYLVNSYGKRELLPYGTRVKIGSGESSTFAGIQNTSNIYYFKDSASPFELNKINEDTETTLDVALDFSFADFTTLPVGKYKVCFELVRIQNPEYPMGEETLSKIYTDEFQVIASAEYGFRYDIDDDTERDNNLAYNKAMDGNNRTISLNMLLNSTLPTDDNSIDSVEIRYQLYKKVKNEENDTYNYEVYTEDSEDNIGLKVDNTDVNLTENSIKTYVVSIEKLPRKGQDNLKVPVELSLNKDTECTNYKMVGEIYVNGIKESSDYIVFNVSDIQVP